jgi:hypothetical protein
VTKAIAGVPESLPRSQYRDLLASLGLDPQRLRGVDLRLQQHRGRMYAEGNEVALHRISIPIVEDVTS